jgi:hypothetical protein
LDAFKLFAGDMLALPVEESRAQRQQRLQARFRDRGGIFVPSQKNTLIDILLARSVTGESPSKRTSSRKNQGSSPVHEKGKCNALDADGERDTAPLASGKAKVEAKRSRESSKKPRGKAAHDKYGIEPDDGQHVAGPSRLDGSDKAKIASQGASSGKGKTKAEVMVVPASAEESRPAPKRKGRPPKTNLPGKETQADDDDDNPKNKPIHPVPKPRGRPPKKNQANQTSKVDEQDVSTRTTEAPPKPKMAAKKRPRVAESDQEDDSPSSDYRPSSRKRAKSVKAATAKSAATTIRKKRTVQAPQHDDSDSSAIVIVAKKKAVKVDTGQTLVDPKKKQSASKARTGTHEDKDDSSPTPKLKARQGAKAQPPKISHYDDDDDHDSEETQVDRPTRNGVDVKEKSNRGGADPPPDSDDGENTKSKPKTRNRARLTKLAKSVAAPDSNGEGGRAKAPSKLTTRVKTHLSTSSGRTTDKTAAKGSNKRSRDAAGGDGEQSDFEESIPPPPARKRAKAIASPASEDETLVGSARSKAVTIPLSAVGKDDPPRATLKENAVTSKSKAKSATTKGKQVQPKQPSQAKVHKGPPQEVLNRIKARPPPSSPRADSDTDPIDFLS